jgi:diguanylate cyclase (GGDEF)-like protein
VAPLRSRDGGVAGVLTLERLGVEARFEDAEFELIKLFAGHVSIALANALAHEAVEIRARTDALTGLKNQGTFGEYLTRTTGRGQPFSLLIIDLDDFKSFNDQYGHEAGNRLLQSIAQSIRRACRETDEVFRYGGDEFAIVLTGASGRGALEAARKVSEAVQSATVPGVRRATGLTCSIGVASFPVDGADRDALLLAADRACYAAKRRGRSLVATAVEGRSLAGEFLPPPTPVDEVAAERHAA